MAAVGASARSHQPRPTAASERRRAASSERDGDEGGAGEGPGGAGVRRERGDPGRELDRRAPPGHERSDGGARQHRAERGDGGGAVATGSAPWPSAKRAQRDSRRRAATAAAASARRRSTRGERDGDGDEDDAGLLASIASDESGGERDHAAACARPRGERAERRARASRSGR